MKKYLFCLLLMLSPLALTAQEVTPDDSFEAPDTLPTAKHVLFEGIEVKGDIFEFTKAMQGAGFKLERRDANARNYVFRGNVCGAPTVFKVSFTRKTRTVYRVMAQLKNMPLDQILKALNERYGDPYDITERGYQWQLPTGAVMLGTPEGYDPTLVVMDGEGVGRYKEEES